MNGDIIVGFIKRFVWIERIVLWKSVDEPLKFLVKRGHFAIMRVMADLLKVVDDVTYDYGETVPQNGKGVTCGSSQGMSRNWWRRWQVAQRSVLRVGKSVLLGVCE